ncbi:unnamed protein product [Schistocephalus solidus]|uniref:Reverse transcriptase domain-containing protein n=1 Tax=Schistocephalus solidus TaxID=70667 RepID=A0A183SUW2_SCHSO|nr:unnamed protein product [Schistocephalus solidus]
MWLHYVDDTFVVIKNCEVERLHENPNGVFPAKQFTHEGAAGDILPFLDVTVQRLSDGKLSTSVHRKDSNAEIILNYGSNHPDARKRSCVRALFHHAFRYCNHEYLLKNELAFLYELFRFNGYPMSFVKNSLQSHTDRRLGTRINEHKLAIRRRNSLSLVFAHAVDCDHRFNGELLHQDTGPVLLVTLITANRIPLPHTSMPPSPTKRSPATADSEASSVSFNCLEVSLNLTVFTSPPTPKKIDLFHFRFHCCDQLRAVLSP